MPIKAGIFELVNEHESIRKSAFMINHNISNFHFKSQNAGTGGIQICIVNEQGNVTGKYFHPKVEYSHFF